MALIEIPICANKTNYDDCAHIHMGEDVSTAKLRRAAFDTFDNDLPFVR